MDDPATRLKGRQPRLGDGPDVSRPGPAGNHTDAWRGGGLTLRPREHGLRSRDHGHNAVRPADAAAGLQRVRWRRRNSGCGGCDPGEILGGCASSLDGAAVAGGGRLGATATTVDSMFTLTFWFWRLATFGNDRPRGRAGAGRIFWNTSSKISKKISTYFFC